MPKPLTQGIDIFSVSNYTKFRVQLVGAKTVYWDVVVDAMDKPHAVKLAVRQYRDSGKKEDPWDTIIVKRAA